MPFGMLRIRAMRVASVDQLSRRRRRLARWALAAFAAAVVVESDATSDSVGVDREGLSLQSPVRCTIRPGALRVRLPVIRPGLSDLFRS